MAENERQERLVERIQEDERLRGDLGGDAAKALVAWASERVAEATSDPQRPDAEVEEAVLAIRSAARSASHSGASDPEAVIANAEAALAGAQADTSQSNDQQVASAAKVADTAKPEEQVAQLPEPAAKVAEASKPAEQAAQPLKPAAKVPKQSTPVKPSSKAQPPKTIGAATPISGSLRRQLNDWIARRFPRKKKRR